MVLFMTQGTKSRQNGKVSPDVHTRGVGGIGDGLLVMLRPRAGLALTHDRPLHLAELALTCIGPGLVYINLYITSPRLITGPRRQIGRRFN